ncbi:unnamed protein product [Lactuca saligna]|uniref:Uncharacterized protein n=1 Tax=Lactuca saligna TaxID=75948 RepID=A0AA36A4M4_LACSI|nr:unnamed protein product [Lactuca saligna]
MNLTIPCELSDYIQAIITFNKLSYQNYESYEVLYKKLLTYLKKENISLPKDLVVKQEKPKKWVDEEESSDNEEPKGKCIMVHIDEFHTEKCDNRSNMVDDDLSLAARDSKRQDWVPSFILFSLPDDLHG